MNLRDVLKIVLDELEPHAQVLYGNLGIALPNGDARLYWDRIPPEDRPRLELYYKHSQKISEWEPLNETDLRRYLKEIIERDLGKVTS